MPPVPDDEYEYFSRVLFQFGNEALVVTGGKARMHRDHIGRGGDIDDGGEVGHRVVRDLGVDRRVGRRGRHRGHAQ
jgi:hypothetical protein